MSAHLNHLEPGVAPSRVPPHKHGDTAGHAGDPTQQRTPGQGHSARGQARTVLVVDDNRDTADTLAAILKAWGYVTIVAYDGPAALAALQDHIPDVALLDIDMPAMDGYELAAHLRFQPGCETMPIIAITGLDGADEARRSRALGFAAYLVKPVDPASIATLLR